MRFSLYTLLIAVLFAGSVMAFVWRFPGWRLERELAPDRGPNQTPIGFSPDGTKFMVGTHRDEDISPAGYTLAAEWHVIDLRTGAWTLARSAKKFSPTTGSGGITFFSVSNDLRYAAVLDDHGQIVVSDFFSGRIIQSMPISAASIELALTPVGAVKLAFSAESPTILVLREPLFTETRVMGAISAEPNGTVATYIYWKDSSSITEYACTDGPPKAMATYHADPDLQLCYRIIPYQRRIVCFDTNARIVEYDWAARREREVVHIDVPKSGNVLSKDRALSKDARYAAFGANDLRLYDLAQATPQCVQKWNLNDCSALDFSADGASLYALQITGGTSTLRELSVVTGEELSRIESGINWSFYASNNERVALWADSDRKTLIYVRNHPGGWAGQFHRAETWLMILFSGLLLQRFLSRLRRRV